jgi:hypothetical protein
MTPEERRRAQTAAAREKSAETRVRKRLTRAAQEMRARGLTIEELLRDSKEPRG